jgi:hypothetical protein
VRLETAVDGKVVDWGTMIGRITDAIDAEMSAKYQRTLAKNTVSGKLQKLRDVTTNGLLGQPPTYGRLREIVRVDGSRIVATSVVDPAHGPIVEQMFRLYCQPGWSVRKIALHLNRENIPSMRGGVWSCSAVRGVLENPLHAGDYRYGVLRRGKHAAMGPAGTILDRDRDDKVARGEPVIIRNAVEPTVPRALFDQVHVRPCQRTRFECYLASWPVGRAGRRCELSGIISDAAEIRDLESRARATWFAKMPSPTWLSMD